MVTCGVDPIARHCNEQCYNMPRHQHRDASWRIPTTIARHRAPLSAKQRYDTDSPLLYVISRSATPLNVLAHYLRTPSSHLSISVILYRDVPQCRTAARSSRRVTLEQQLIDIVTRRASSLYLRLDAWYNTTAATSSARAYAFSFASLYRVIAFSSLLRGR